MLFFDKRIRLTRIFSTRGNMKKAFIKTLAMVIFSSACISSPVESFEVPYESISNFSLPDNFNMKKLYEWNNSVLFKSGDVIFAQGTFNKKFSLKTPYGKSISTTRLYELVPNNRPLLIVRDDEGHVLGFIQLENYRSTQIFQPVTGIVYDKHGTNILKTKFPLASKYCQVYSVVNDSYQLVASTEKGLEGDFSVRFSTPYQDLGLDPVFLISLLHIHADKSLLVNLADLGAIDDIEINDLANYAQKTDGEKWVKNLSLAAEKENMSKWLELKEKLEEETYPIFISEEEKEAIAFSLAQRFQKEDHNGRHNGQSNGKENNQTNNAHKEESIIQEIEDAIEGLLNEEKAVLLEIINSRFGF